MARTKGAKAITATAEVLSSRCPTCGSSERTAYENSSYQDYSGSGLDFVGIWYRTTRCLKCGQARRDKEKVYASKSPTKTKDELAEYMDDYQRYHVDENRDENIAEDLASGKLKYSA